VTDRLQNMGPKFLLCANARGAWSSARGKSKSDEIEKDLTSNLVSGVLGARLDAGEQLLEGGQLPHAAELGFNRQKYHPS